MEFKMELERKLAIAAALRAYFVGIGHIDATTDKQCKSWLAHCVDYNATENDEWQIAVVCELTVFTNCCCNTDDKEFEDECGWGPYQQTEEFTILHWSQDEAQDLAEWLTNGEGANHWILSKDKAE